MECAAYARQSVEKKNSLSIEGQIDLCQKAAGQALTVYEDRGYSGKNTERPAFQKLIRDIKDGKISRLYVYRLDRFSRSVADFGNLWEILQANNVEFVSVNENFDTSTPMGRAMLHIIMVFAQLERETTAERVKDNYYRRAALGSWPGGPAPYGFSITRAITQDGRMAPTLAPNENAPIIQRIFEAYAQEDASLGTVAQLLNREGILSSRRATWDNVALSRILHNPVYAKADEQVYLYYKGREVNVTSPREAFDGLHGLLLVGKRESSQRKYTDVSSHMLSVLDSPGLVPSDLWLACQEKLGHNQQISNSRRGTHTWLTGLLKCAKCGYSIKVLKEPSGFRLICSGRYNLSKCDATIQIRLEELEREVEGGISALLAECPEEDVSIPGEDNRFQAQLDELDRRADRLVDAFASSSDLNTAYLHRALSRLEQERQELLDARKREQNRPLLPDKLDFSKLSFEDKKTVAAQFIRRIDLHQDHADIIWNV